MSYLVTANYIRDLEKPEMKAKWMQSWSGISSQKYSMISQYHKEMVSLASSRELGVTPFSCKRICCYGRRGVLCDHFWDKVELYIESWVTLTLQCNERASDECQLTLFKPHFVATYVSKTGCCDHFRQWIPILTLSNHSIYLSQDIGRVKTLLHVCIVSNIENLGMERCDLKPI